jgi:type III restriction enzyme
LKIEPDIHLILETKGFDELAEVKTQAAQRWVNAVNADGTYGVWRFAMARKIGDVRGLIEGAASSSHVHSQSQTRLQKATAPCR